MRCSPGPNNKIKPTLPKYKTLPKKKVEKKKPISKQKGQPKQEKSCSIWCKITDFFTNLYHKIKRAIYK